MGQNSLREMPLKPWRRRRKSSSGRHSCLSKTNNLVDINLHVNLLCPLKAVLGIMEQTPSPKEESSATERDRLSLSLCFYVLCWPSQLPFTALRHDLLPIHSIFKVRDDDT
jgi:hypothetical protein